MILTLLAWAFYLQLNKYIHGGDYASFLRETLSLKNLFLLPVAVLMVPLNWYLESRKWQLLTGSMQVFPFKRVWESVFAGLTLGLITPGRIGELAGRVWYLVRENRSKLFVVSWVGGLAQWVVLLNVAVPAASVLLPVPSFLIMFLFPLISISSLLIYFRSDGVLKLTYRIYSKIRKKITDRELPKVEGMIKADVLILSALRYMVYLFQYVFLILVWDSSIDWQTSAMAVSSIFLLQSLSPFPGVLDAGWKGNIAIWVLHLAGVNSLAAIAATFTLWLINLYIPGIYGYVLLNREKLNFLLKAEGYTP